MGVADLTVTILRMALCMMMLRDKMGVRACGYIPWAMVMVIVVMIVIVLMVML